MSQATNWSVPLNGPVGPTVYSQRVDDSLDALLSQHAGAARPAYAVTGTEWVSTATAGKLKVYRYDGANDRLLMTIDVATGVIAYNDGVGDDPFLKKSGGVMSGPIDLAGSTLKNAGSGVADYVKDLTTSKTSAYVVSTTAGQMKGNGRLVINAAAFTKNLNAPWVAGSGNGGRLSAAAIAANTTYHLHALSKDSDGSFDWGYDVSATAPTVPAGYTWVGRFDWCYTNATPNAIVDYSQVDSVKYFSDTSWFVITSVLADAAYTLPATVPVPSGIRTEVMVKAIATANSGGTINAYLNDGAPGTNAGSGPIVVTASGPGTAIAFSGGGKLKTDTSRQLRAAVTVAGSAGTVNTYVSSVEDYTLNRIY